MSRRTSLASMDDMKSLFSPPSNSESAKPVFSLFSKNSRDSVENDSGDSDDSIMLEAEVKSREGSNGWRTYQTDSIPGKNNSYYDNMVLSYKSKRIGVGSFVIASEYIYWCENSIHSSCAVLRWEMSRVKEIHFYIQNLEVPHCCIDIFSNEPSNSESAIDSFILSQDVDDAIDQSIAKQQFSTLRNELQQAYSSMKQDMNRYLSHLVKSYVKSTPSIVESSYIKSLHDTILSISSYPLPNESVTLQPYESFSLPLQQYDKKDQQRIFLPYKQSLIMSLGIQEELKSKRFLALGLEIVKNENSDGSCQLEYNDLETKRRVEYEEVEKRWARWYESNRRKDCILAEVEEEKKLYLKYDVELNKNVSSIVQHSATSPPSVRRLSNPMTSPPRLHTKPLLPTEPAPETFLPSKATASLDGANDHNLGEEVLLELFDVYLTEVKKRKDQLYHDLEDLTVKYHTDMESLLDHFVSVLEEQGVDDHTIEDLLRKQKEHV